MRPTRKQSLKFVIIIITTMTIIIRWKEKGENEELILHDTFAQEMRVTVEGHNMYFFIFNP